jgi:hypothetical protein
MKYKVHLLLLGFLACYVLANTACILLPFIPGIEVFFIWGIILPVLSLIGTWIVIKKQGKELKGRWFLGCGVTLAILASSIATIKIVTDIWASI